MLYEPSETKQRTSIFFAVSRILNVRGSARVSDTTPPVIRHGNGKSPLIDGFP